MTKPFATAQSQRCVSASEQMPAFLNSALPWNIIGFVKQQQTSGVLQIQRDGGWTRGVHAASLQWAPAAAEECGCTSPSIHQSS